MTTPQEPPRWDAPPQGPAWDRPSGAGAPGWGPPPTPAPAGHGGPPAHGPRDQQTDAKAIVALVLALASYPLLPFLAAIAALLVARASQRDIDASGGRLTGRGLLTAARVLSWINIALCVLAVVLLALGVALLASVGFS